MEEKNVYTVSDKTGKAFASAVQPLKKARSVLLKGEKENTVVPFEVFLGDIWIITSVHFILGA